MFSQLEYYIYEYVVQQQLLAHLNKQAVWIKIVLIWFYGLEWEKIQEYDVCPHQEYLVVVSRKLKSLLQVLSNSKLHLIILFLSL